MKVVSMADLVGAVSEHFRRELDTFAVLEEPEARAVVVLLMGGPEPTAMKGALMIGPIEAKKFVREFPWESVPRPNVAMHYCAENHGYHVALYSKGGLAQSEFAGPTPEGTLRLAIKGWFNAHEVAMKPEQLEVAASLQN